VVISLSVEKTPVMVIEGSIAGVMLKPLAVQNGETMKVD
jgi:hypothetical protein